MKRSSEEIKGELHWRKEEGKRLFKRLKAEGADFVKSMQAVRQNMEAQIRLLLEEPATAAPRSDDCVEVPLEAWRVIATRHFWRVWTRVPANATLWRLCDRRSRNSCLAEASVDAMVLRTKDYQTVETGAVVICCECAYHERYYDTVDAFCDEKASRGITTIRIDPVMHKLHDWKVVIREALRVVPDAKGESGAGQEDESDGSDSSSSSDSD